MSRSPVSDAELKEREEYMREMAKEVWPVVKSSVGITWRVKCPPIEVTNRPVYSKGGRHGVWLSRHASEGILVHELLHSAMMMMPGAIKTTKNGRRILHNSRMRFLERTICEKLGFEVRGWAIGAPCSPYHNSRQKTLREARAQGCLHCKGELEKVSVIRQCGTIFRCKACKVEVLI